ncbi:MarR family winged helix-turn-helix transcriptional regulator [Nocardia rhizosphaerihabitans]|uniref:MarR family winged helix-turn-helix transcriptional regulator n=1 Tax=Nocardia rhizosphaerihabitans TaxID=1691570 RepID=UPI00367237B2
MTERRLIGYQVKRLDQLIEATFDQAVESVGMSRREWQTLNSIISDPAADLAEALRPFWEVDGESITDVTAALAARRWITRDADARYAVTDTGLTAHETAARAVGIVRRELADGITEAEFATLTGTLARMIANLEQAG